MNRSFQIFVIIIILLMGSITSTFASSTEDKRVVLFLIGELAWEDITPEKMPFLSNLGKQGSIGLLNTSARGVNQKAAAYLALGAGVKLQAVKDIELVFQGNETWKGFSINKYLEKVKATKIMPENAVLPVSQQLFDVNEDRVAIGMLGQVLGENGKKLSVVGNQDIDIEIMRFTPLVAMLPNGIIPNAIIDKRLLTQEHPYPFIFGTNYSVMLEKTYEQYSIADLLVVQLSDKERLMEVKKNIAEELFEQYNLMILREIDDFLKELSAKFNMSKTMVIALNPYPANDDREQKNTLTPIIVNGKEITGGSWLISSSTKRQGIVSNIDVAPTILSFFNIDRPGYIAGHKITSSDKIAQQAELTNMLARLINIHNLRPGIIKPYIFSIIVLLSAIAVCLFFKKQKVLKNLKPLLVVITLFPLIYLYLPINSSTALWLFWVETILLVAILTCILNRLFRGLKMFYIVYQMTSLAILIDLLGGAKFIKYSVLGYDPISGARYYGIGNEFMGVLVGASIMAAGISLDNIKTHQKAFKTFWSFYFSLAFLIIGSPFLGTNVGGAIASSVGFILALFIFYYGRITIKQGIFSMFMITGFLIGAFLFDFRQPIENQSHIGRLANNIIENGISPFITIIKRKMLINYKLVKYTIWSRVFLVSLLVMLLAFIQPKGILRARLEKYPHMGGALLATFISSLVVLVVNDSGIVAAATVAIYLVPPVLYLLLESVQ